MTTRPEANAPSHGPNEAMINISNTLQDPSLHQFSVWNGQNGLASLSSAKATNIHHVCRKICLLREEGLMICFRGGTLPLVMAIATMSNGNITGRLSWSLWLPGEHISIDQYPRLPDPAHFRRNPRL